MAFPEHTTFRGDFLKGSIAQHLGLSDLLEEDLTSYEYFHSLPKELKRRVEAMDATSFEEMQSCVAKWKNKKPLR